MGGEESNARMGPAAAGEGRWLESCYLLSSQSTGAHTYIHTHGHTRECTHTPCPGLLSPARPIHAPRLPPSGAQLVDKAAGTLSQSNRPPETTSGPQEPCSG